MQIEQVNGTNIIGRVFITTASATAGATARVGVRVVSKSGA
jgi:hypothetical protein